MAASKRQPQSGADTSGKQQTARTAAYAASAPSVAPPAPNTAPSSRRVADPATSAQAAPASIPSGNHKSPLNNALGPKSQQGPNPRHPRVQLDVSGNTESAPPAQVVGTKRAATNPPERAPQPSKQFIAKHTFAAAAASGLIIDANDDDCTSDDDDEEEDEDEAMHAPPPPELAALLEEFNILHGSISELLYAAVTMPTSDTVTLSPNELVNHILASVKPSLRKGRAWDAFCRHWSSVGRKQFRTSMKATMTALTESVGIDLFESGRAPESSIRPPQPNDTNTLRNRRQYPSIPNAHRTEDVRAANARRQAATAPSGAGRSTPTTGSKPQASTSQTTSSAPAPAQNNRMHKPQHNSGTTATTHPTVASSTATESTTQHNGNNQALAAPGAPGGSPPNPGQDPRAAMDAASAELPPPDPGPHKA